MITVEQIKDINCLIPGEDETARLRRRVVCVLADAGGRLGLPSLVEALGGGWGAVVAEARQWDGLRWSGVGNGTSVWLAPWVRARLGLVSQSSHCPSLDGQDEDEPSAYHRPSLAEGLRGVTAAARPQPAACAIDPLADIRAAVARARNVSTVAEALAHAYPGEEVVETLPAVLPRDCPGVPC